MIDPGDAAAIGCNDALWARFDPDGAFYEHLAVTPEGHILISGSRARGGSGEFEGVIVHRLADAGLKQVVVESQGVGSEMRLGGVGLDGRYAADAGVFLGLDCWWDEFDEEHCTPQWERSIRAYASDDVLLWERFGEHQIVGVRGDVTVALRDGALVRYDPSGALLEDTPLPYVTPRALAPDDGYFATISGASIGRLDPGLDVLWSVALVDLGLALDHVAPAPDGGVVLAGRAGTGQRLVRLGADGVELWRRDLGILSDALTESRTIRSVAVGPDGDVAAGGVGWLGYLRASGELGWILRCPGVDTIASVAVDADQIIAAGPTYVAAFAKDPPPEQLAFCGNQAIEPGETCDEGLDNGHSLTCDATCQSSFCGDQIVGPGETCDEGPANGGAAACTGACQSAVCGDGLVHDGVEACDGGSTCSASCHFAPPTTPCADPTLCPHVVWSRGLVGLSASADKLALDEGGEVIVGGDFVDALDLGGDVVGEGVLTSPSPSFFALRLTANAETAGYFSPASGSSSLGAMVRSPDGGLVLAGNYRGTLDLGGPPLVSPPLFIAGLDPAGEHLWSASFSGSADEVEPRTRAAVDGAGEIILAGSFGGTLNLGGSALISAGGEDLYVARLGPDGEHLWSARFGDAQDQRAVDVAVDASGAVVVTGVFSGTVDFGGGPLLAPPGDDARLLARLDPDGAHLWSRSLGSDDGDAAIFGGPAIEVDGAGGIYVATEFFGDIDLGDGPIASTGSDVLLAKLAEDGAVLWASAFASTGGQYFGGLAANAAGELALVGRSEGPIDLGGGPLNAMSTGFLGRFGPGGEHRWSLAIPRPDLTSSTYIEAVAVDDDGDVVVSGRYSGSLAFGGAAFVTTNWEERLPFIARLGPL